MEPADRNEVLRSLGVLGELPVVAGASQHLTGCAVSIGCCHLERGEGLAWSQDLASPDEAIAGAFTQTRSPTDSRLRVLLYQLPRPRR